MTTTATPDPTSTPEHKKLMHDAAALSNRLEQTATQFKPDSIATVIGAIGMLMATKSADAATALRYGEAISTAVVAMFNIKQVTK